MYNTYQFFKSPCAIPRRGGLFSSIKPLVYRQFWTSPYSTREESFFYSISEQAASQVSPSLSKWLHSLTETRLCIKGLQ